MVFSFHKLSYLWVEPMFRLRASFEVGLPAGYCSSVMMTWRLGMNVNVVESVLVLSV